MRYCVCCLFCVLFSSFVMGKTQLAVIVSSESTIAKIDAAALQAVFLGLLTQEPELRALKPLDLSTGDTRDFFYQNLVGRNRHQMQSYWSRMSFTGRGTPPQEVTPEHLMSELVKNPALIAYLPIENVSTGMKVLMLIP